MAPLGIFLNYINTLLVLILMLNQLINKKTHVCFFVYASGQENFEQKRSWLLNLCFLLFEREGSTHRNV